MRLISIILILIFASPVLSQDIVPLVKGSPAPFSGLLVPENKFKKFLLDGIELKGMTEKFELEKKLTTDLEKMYQEKLSKAVEVKWYKSPSFNRWIGLFIGVTVTCLAFWGATEIQKAVTK